ncbi:MAG: AraC family transcriptional regulator, partial [Oscillospiraceae bacterium]|nr:AraC family transcriptional regulator [Oscillospiraceae bacterium]
EETGLSLTDFILKEKTEEAKRLLCYSGKSLLNIGNYLGFSSQSHFCRVFKEITGITPKEYQKKFTVL